MSEHTCNRDGAARCNECAAEESRRYLAKAKALPNGTPCLVTRDDGSILHSVTRSDPWELGSGQWVVRVEGISGGYAVERVRKADVEAIHAWLCKIRYVTAEKPPKRCDGTHGGTPCADEACHVRFIDEEMDTAANLDLSLDVNNPQEAK